jgi:hypothetical protein
MLHLVNEYLQNFTVLIASTLYFIAEVNSEGFKFGLEIIALVFQER